MPVGQLDTNTIFRMHPMQEYKAVVKQEGEWWYGWIEEIPGVNCQERSKDELMESLRATLQEAIELNRDDA
jgi:predicted RNase H-like HicB family nuclease